MTKAKRLLAILCAMAMMFTMPVSVLSSMMNMEEMMPTP